MTSTLRPAAAADRPVTGADAPRRRGPDTPPDWFLTLVSVLVVLLVVTQRIGVPVGDEPVSIALVLAYAFAGVSLAGRLLTVSRVRAGLYTVAVSAVLLTTATVSWLGWGADFSMSSLWLLIVIYLPWVLRVRDPYGAAVVARAGRTFIWTMLVLAVVGVVQLASQFAGVWSWEDHLGELVPGDYLVPGYNFTNELTYGNPIRKATGVVLLEPSFLSQFCALAILIGIMLRVRAWKLLVLAAGMGAAVSGTGLVMLGVGGVLLLLRAPHRLRIGYVAVAAVVPVVILQSPVGEYFLARDDELTNENTSGYSRFVAPFDEVWNGLLEEPIRFLVGNGPGSVTRVLLSLDNGGVDVNYSVLPKLALEYGILAGGLFLVFLVLAVVDRAPWRVVPATMVFMALLLSGALLQPQTAYIVWLLSGIGASDRPADLPWARRGRVRTG
ncbi:hypothetical protein SAMN05660464_2199 [Geodermatophilus dictyosporus]|uniref:O-antigen ligase like membrane protein n=1 Tax=Geodermatophilus dictyosporus TaxID=1523247 RepID=A0A1I5MXJ4_9ACTN|nr:hypothetical protein [Geodermatophilus dictyosporus]SFP14203.1 hypothetical protein SAMN05660464_2199 [Geodermatophilus dictyosporus]